MVSNAETVSMLWRHYNGPVLAWYQRTKHRCFIMTSNFPCYWPLVRGVHWFSVVPPHKGQRRGALKFSLICAWTNGPANSGDAGDWRRRGAHYDVTVLSNVRWRSARRWPLPNVIIAGSSSQKNNAPCTRTIWGQMRWFINVRWRNTTNRHLHSSIRAGNVEWVLLVNKLPS